MGVVLLLLFGYGFVMGAFIVFRRDTIWQFQTYRRASRDLPAQPRTEEWDSRMLGIGVVLMAVCGVAIMLTLVL